MLWTQIGIPDHYCHLITVAPTAKPTATGPMTVVPLPYRSSSRSPSSNQLPPVPPPLTPLPNHCAARHASTAAAHSDPTAERIADYADQPADTAADCADEHAKSSTGRANCPRDRVNEDYQHCTEDQEREGLGLRRSSFGDRQLGYLRPMSSSNLVERTGQWCLWYPNHDCN